MNGERLRVVGSAVQHFYAADFRSLSHQHYRRHAFMLQLR